MILTGPPKPPARSRAPRTRVSRRRQLARGLTRIRLGGALGRRFGQEHALAVNSPGEAVEALEANFPGFKAQVLKLTGYKFLVRAGGKIVHERELRARKQTGAKTISFVPVAKGSGNGKAIGSAIAGVLLIVVGVVLAFTGVGAAATPYLTAQGVSLVAGLAISAGLSLALAGVSALISGNPTTASDSQGKRQKPNAQFDGPSNITEQGAPIACVYGELTVGGNIISQSIQSVDVKAAVETNDPNIVPPDVTVTPGAGASFHAVGGSGGGGGAASAGATEAKDTLRSTQYGRLQILHGVGPVEGIVDGMQGVFVEQTPMQNPDGTGNFRGWKFDFRDGSSDQDFIPGFEANENTIAESVEVKQQYPYIRHFDDQTIDAVRIDLRYPELSRTNNKSGDKGGTEVEIAIDISQNGGAWQTVVGHENGGYIKGKGTAYTRSHEIQLPRPGPWDIRVRRITADSSSVYLANKTFVDARTLITYVKLSHPNRCKSAIQIDAQQFSSFPRLAVKLRGRKVRVPTNYDPIARTYGNGGVWDGTFKTAWTNNPAWIFFDFATNTGFGVGNAKAETGNLKWELYNCARYNDEPVPNGNGGTEPRYVCNCCIQQAQEAPRVLSDIASSMGAAVYFRAGEIGVCQDRPRTYTAKSFMPENVENGVFRYVGVAKDARHNLARVRWNDPDNFFAVDVEPYEDGEAVANDQGVFNPLDITAFGCTSRGGAYRRGRYSIITEQLEGEVVTFTTGLDAADLTPGDLIQTFNPFRSGSKTSQGRIKAVISPTVLQLDRVPDPVVLGGGDPKLCIHYVDENERGEACTKVASLAIHTTNMAGDLVHLSAAPTFTVLPQQAWGLQSSRLAPELWRVLSIAHEGGLRHSINAHKYNASKYGAVDFDFALVQPVTSLLPNSGVCLPPGALTVAETFTANAASLVRSLDISCVPSADAFFDAYEFSYRVNSGNWTLIEETASNHTTLPNAPSGDYEVRVRARNKVGAFSAFVSAALATADAPALIVTGFQLVDGKTTNIYKGRHAKFTWRKGNSPVQSADVGEEPDGVTDGTEDPLLQGYEFGVFDLATKEQVHSELLAKANTKAKFTEEENIEAFGVYTSDYRAGVRAIDATGRNSPWTVLDVSNGPPGRPKALIVAHPKGALHTNHLLWVNANDTDLNKTHIRYAPDEGVSFDAALEVGVVGRNVVYFAHTGVTGTKKAHYWVQHEDAAGNLGEPYPPRDQPGVGVTMGGLSIGSGDTQLNTDLDGNEWFGSGDFAGSPIRFAADGSIYISGTGNNIIDPGAIGTNVKSPKLVPASTSFQGSIDLTLTSKTLGAKVIYTTDGSEPGPGNGTVVANGTTITLTATTTVKAVARKLGMYSNEDGNTQGSQLRVQTYTQDSATCAEASMTPPGGTFNPAQFPMAVSLACPTAGAAIYYSLTHLPTAAGDGTLYAGTPVAVPSGATLYARAFRSGLTPSMGLAQLYAPLNDTWSGGSPPAGGGGYDLLQN